MINLRTFNCFFQSLSLSLRKHMSQLFIIRYEEAELERYKRERSSKEAEKKDEEEEEEKIDLEIEEEDTVAAHAGHLWKEAQSGRMFGLAAKHWQKRYFKLCRGRLSWFESKSSVRLPYISFLYSLPHYSNTHTHT